ncbi:27 kDa hemolymph protein [Frankliniella fusca]|uniref:27 kDa hemolymph protein n=1 Tax=Frankliniella fusca TaxID=407009 RepID=A0AAE1I0S9_9NEOP|nr:27 kDa hemolymph protein [Frankliniella fusca]
MKWIILTVLVYGAALVLSDDIDDLDLNLDLPKVESKFPSIPGLENLPINRSALPNINPEEIERALQEKCEKNGGEDAYRTAKNAGENAQSCVSSLINVTELMEKMEKAKPTGDLDEVFREYCQKSPLFKDCVMDFVNSTNQCLSEEERDSKKLVQNVTDQLLGFVCFKQGDRIALFIAESGPECISDKKEAIVHCINATFGKHLPSGTPNLYTTIPQLIVGAEECKDVCALQRCVVRELEKCKEPTPANIVQSMFDYILKVTPCTGCKAERLKLASGSSKYTYSIFSLALSMILFLNLHGL